MAFLCSLCIGQHQQPVEGESFRQPTLRLTQVQIMVLERRDTLPYGCSHKLTRHVRGDFSGRQLAVRKGELLLRTVLRFGRIELSGGY